MSWRVAAEPFVSTGVAMPWAADGARLGSILSSTTGLGKPVAGGGDIAPPSIVTGGSIPPAR